MKKISDLYGKKARALLSHKLSGNYAFGYKIKGDYDEALKIAQLVFKHGGIFMKSIKNNGTVILPDNAANSLREDLKKRNLKYITVSELLELVRLE